MEDPDKLLSRRQNGVTDRQTPHVVVNGIKSPLGPVRDHRQLIVGLPILGHKLLCFEVEPACLDPVLLSGVLLPIPLNVSQVDEVEVGA